MSRPIPSFRPHHPRHAAAFTVIELMVVIGIIVVLMAILVPLISKVRTASQTAATQAEIQALSGAINAYHDSFSAYPGPLDDKQMFGISGVPLPANIQVPANAQITMAENLFLGIVGGLSTDGTTVRFDPPQLSAGPKDLSSATGKIYQPFLKDWVGQVSGGFFTDFRGLGVGDTNIPEFVDRYTSHPTPILYLRARMGAPGICSDASTPNAIEQYQYDLRQFAAYTISGLNALPQGLNDLGSFAPLDPNGVNSVLPYLANPGNPGTSNQFGNPRVKDTFILISAGPDGIFGTRDDITSFGSIVQ